MNPYVSHQAWLARKTSLWSVFANVAGIIIKEVLPFLPELIGKVPMTFIGWLFTIMLGLSLLMFAVSLLYQYIQERSLAEKEGWAKIANKWLSPIMKHSFLILFLFFIVAVGCAGWMATGAEEAKTPTIKARTFTNVSARDLIGLMHDPKTEYLALRHLGSWIKVVGTVRATRMAFPPPEDPTAPTYRILDVSVDWSDNGIFVTKTVRLYLEVKPETWLESPGNGIVAEGIVSNITDRFLTVMNTKLVSVD